MKYGSNKKKSFDYIYYLRSATKKILLTIPTPSHLHFHFLIGQVFPVLAE